jgi:hypothetical protein
MYQEESVLPLLNEGDFVMESEVCPFRRRGKISLNLFDRDGKSIAKKAHPSFAKFTERILSSPNCFTCSIKDNGNQGIEIQNFHFFETLYALERKPSHMREFTCYVYDHSLTREMLYTIKHFQLTTGSLNYSFGGCPRNFTLGCNIHKLHPELFNPSPVEELDKLRIRLNFKESILEKKEIRLNDEETKVLEEKKRLLSVKKRLDLMKRELQLERDAFEKEKREHDIKNIDLDDYFQIPVATVVATKVSPTVGEIILGEYADL